MGKTPTGHTLTAAVLAVGIGCYATVHAGLQDERPLGEQVDALQCWRRVDRHAVRIGEPFTMLLTCSDRGRNDGFGRPDTHAEFPARTASTGKLGEP